jgi:hypothetical protein
MTPAASGCTARGPASRPPTAPANAPAAASARTAGSSAPAARSGAQTGAGSATSAPTPTDQAATSASNGQRPGATSSGTRPKVMCSACGGLRAWHTVHHDQAAHQRAQRRHDALLRKAAATTFAHEAAACRAKAQTLRVKYGL